MSTKETDPIEYLNKLVDAQGVACSTVSDGHVLIFTRTFLRDLVEKNADKEKLVIFVKRPEFKN